MKIAFTICSNNYLAQAKTLGDSIIATSPDYKFYIGLVDKLNEGIDYDKEIEHNIILVENIGIPDFDELWKKFSIIELNTCVKPFFLEYFISNFGNIEYIYYLDPDTFVYNNLRLIEEEFGPHNKILLTPHILTPIKLDGKTPDEPIFLNHGLYNLGFLGLKDPKSLLSIIDWWKERTREYGYDRTSEGLFVDQLWFNLVPLYYQRVKHSFNLGLNMGPWNLHERYILNNNNILKVNNRDILVFFHFSNFSFDHPEELAPLYNRYSLEERNDLKPIYSAYYKRLIDNNIEKLSLITCYYMNQRSEFLKAREIESNRITREQEIGQRTYKWWIKRILYNVLPPIILKTLKSVYRLA